MSEWGDWCRMHHERDDIEAACRLIEAHDATKAEFEAFKRDVSEAVKAFTQIYVSPREGCSLDRFILPEPVDPLVAVIQTVRSTPLIRTDEELAEDFRTELAKRGLTIKEQQS